MQSCEFLLISSDPVVIAWSELISLYMTLWSLSLSLCRSMAVTLTLQVSFLTYPAVKGCFVWGRDVSSLDAGPLSRALANTSFSVLWWPFWFTF